MNHGNVLSFRLSLEEKFTIGMVMLFNILILVFMRLGQAGDIFILNIIIITSILIVSRVYNRFPTERFQFFRDWYVPAFLIILYLENRRLIPLSNPHDLDSILIAMDRFLFLGNDPTIFLEKFTHPLLTEILQIAYASFYFLPFTLCLILYLKKPHLEFHINASVILMGFYLSYIGYYITPVIGPRFTLNHLQSLPLTGIFSFDFIRNMIAQAEGIMRDCCPSGHAMISLLTVLLAWRYTRAFFPIAVIWALLIIFSTVYLRYHYVTDLIVGMTLGFVVYWRGLKIIETIIFKDMGVRNTAGIIV
ncbi:MAG: phosphatase PAP2 family protein [Desulfomonilia bacterium]|jgi:membrane-associated phospholipid phosphatase